MKKSLALILIFLTVFALGCKKSKDSATIEEENMQIAKNITIYEAKHGLNTWILTTEKAVFEEKKQEASLIKPALVFKEGDFPSSEIKGNTGYINLEKHIITISGNVVGESKKESVTIRTSELNYNLEEKKIWTDKKFRLIRNGVTINAQGFKANGDLSEIEIFKQATTLPVSETDF
ncbi:LPS export ABC transporter protein LptC [Parelusimicrobium proximum]|uniref:LPS export ABC transporter periplasmic protein LptC n=1 Tax=Parelusimicrobium proximum TaxID=3228953 RepID=UPI003D16F137